MSAPESSPHEPRWRLILNGKSGDDASLRDAVGAMRAHGVELGVRVTWEAGDAARYVAEAIADGVDTVIAAGGDGTLSEVAGALADRDENADSLPSLGLVPLGTANDFATTAGIPAAPDAALELVRLSPAQAIDLLRIDSGDPVDGLIHWCANLASGGFGTQVTVETDEGMKKVLGGLAYLITGIASLGQVEPVPARIRGAALNGERFQWEAGFIALGIGNGRQAGGGQMLCPDAVIDDGLLDLTVVPELEGTVGRTVAALLTEGRHGALARVAERRQLAWVDIDAPAGFVLSLDGEPVESDRFRIVCVAGRIRMHLPPGCPLLRPPGNPLPVAEGNGEPEPSPSLVPA